MPQEQLRQTLETLRTELQAAERVDESTREQLLALAAEIQRLAEGKAEAEGDEPLADRVQDLMLKFETQHPQLTTALNQVSAALANLGI